MADEDNYPEISMNPDELYRDETITDQKTGTIRVMTPIKDDGSLDESRDVLYIGQSQMMTPAGALPLNFEIEAANLKEAVEKFGDKMKESMQETVERLTEMQRQQSSKIVVPGDDAGLASKIQLR